MKVPFRVTYNAPGYGEVTVPVIEVFPMMVPSALTKQMGISCALLVPAPILQVNEEEPTWKLRIIDASDCIVMIDGTLF